MDGDEAGELAEDLGRLRDALAELDDDDIPPELMDQVEATIGQAEAQLEIQTTSSPILLAVRHAKATVANCLESGMTVAETRAKLEAIADGCDLDDVTRGFLDGAIEEALADA